MSAREGQALLTLFTWLKAKAVDPGVRFDVHSRRHPGTSDGHDGLQRIAIAEMPCCCEQRSINLTSAAFSMR